MEWNAKLWKQSVHYFREFLTPLIAGLGRSERRVAATRSKDDLGLDHFEGRSWRGFHHHLILSAIAYLFILTMYLRRKKNFWCDVGTDSPYDPAVAGEIDRVLHQLRNQIREGSV